jgi:hypothetical protein
MSTDKTKASTAASKAATAPVKSAKPATEKKLAEVDNSPAGKAERFKKIAGRRTKKIITTIGNLGNTSNRNVYGYTQEQVEFIFSAIEKSLSECKKKFAERATQKKVDFDLNALESK